MKKKKAIRNYVLVSICVVALLLLSIFSFSIPFTNYNFNGFVNGLSLGLDLGGGISATFEVETADWYKGTFDEAMNIFSSYRAEFDSHVLGDNSSFLHVTNTLNMPSTWGDENISVSWNISNPDIIDYTGKLQAENIPDDGIVLEVVATLTLDETSADICYQLKVLQM